MEEFFELPAFRISLNENNKNEQEKAEKTNRKEYLKRVQAQADELASSYVRVAGTWYKKCVHPVTNLPVLEHVRAEDIIKDYGKDLGSAILSGAAKCINFVNVPDHLHYQELVGSKSQDTYYNLYKPIVYKPGDDGDYNHIDDLVLHIFGEQYEMGLDYIQLLYLHPMKRLPVLVLVSKENGTGKSTFCNFLHDLFGENCSQITNDTLRSNFNSTWVSKLLVYCEETLLNRREDSEKIKNLTTAFSTPSEAKGKDRTNVLIFLKFILCSNDEDRPIFLTSEDTRHWVRKVPPLENKNPNENFLEECKKEIPAFLRFLTERKLVTKGTDRLWFSPEETRTDAWRRIVAGGLTRLEREIIEMMIYIMDQESLNIIKYDPEGLFRVVKDLLVPYDLKVPFSRDIARDILRGWGLEASKTAVRFDLYQKNTDGTVAKAGSRVGRAYAITKDFLENLII